MEDNRHSFSLWFSAPFRTPLTLRTPAVIGAPARASRALAAAAAALEQDPAVSDGKASGASIPCVESPLAGCLEPGELRYRRLAEDADQQFVSALLEIRGAPGVAAALHNALSDWLDPERDGGRTSFDIHAGSVVIHLFDNTIGLIEWRLDVRIPDEGLAAFWAGIDAVSCDATITAVAAAQSGCVHRAVQTLDEAFRSSLRGRGRTKRRPVVLRPHAFQVFIDIRERMGRARDLRPFDATGDAGVLWVTRLAQVEGARPELHAHLERWSPGLRSRDTQAGFVPAVGNSVYFATRGAPLPDLHASYRKMQYMHALVDVHGRNINALFAEFLAHRHGVLAPTMRTLNAIHSHIGYIRMQSMDVFAGLQGDRLEHANRIRATWGFDAKLEGLSIKSRMAGEEIAALARTSSMRYQKVIQYGLSSVGLLALLDVLINLTAFSHSEEIRPRGTWGLLRIVHSVHPDTIVTSVAITLLAGMCLLGFALLRGHR